MNSTDLQARRFLFTVDVDWVVGSETGVLRLCDFCDRLGIRATFFVAGRFAERYPHVIREVAHRGHALGTHGWEHGSLSATDDENFGLAPAERQRTWLVNASRAVEDASGVSPKAFRAPNLLVSETTLRVLQDVGYSHDSSVSPRRLSVGPAGVRRTRYYRAPLEPYHPSLDDLNDRGASTVLEVPPSAFLLPLNMSALRVLGLAPLQWAVHRLRSRSSILVFYAHPAEFVDGADQVIPADNPARHRRGLGPHHLTALGAFIDGVLELGYVSAALEDLNGGHELHAARNAGSRLA
jgi:peptidoglycan/xylan/chitin deacetylase (PgdA/CDA1 family)